MVIAIKEYMKDIKKLELLEAEIKSYNKIYDEYSEFDDSFKRKVYYSFEAEKIVKMSLKSISFLYYIKKVPTSLRLFNNLKVLNLSKSNFDSNSFSILENMTQLEELDLSQNKIEYFDFLSNLKNLKKLDLTSNQIKDISSLEKLINLEELSIYFNDNFDFPDLNKLKNLEIAGKSIVFKYELPNLRRLNIEVVKN